MEMCPRAVRLYGTVDPNVVGRCRSLQYESAISLNPPLVNERQRNDGALDAKNGDVANEKKLTAFSFMTDSD